jgi:hypothetical protein
MDDIRRVNVRAARDLELDRTLARLTQLSLRKVRALLRRTHGRTLLTTMFGQHWPVEAWQLEHLVASEAQDMWLAPTLSDLTLLAPRTVVRRLERAEDDAPLAEVFGQYWPVYENDEDEDDLGGDEEHESDDECEYYYEDEEGELASEEEEPDNEETHRGGPVSERVEARSSTLRPTPPLAVPLPFVIALADVRIRAAASLEERLRIRMHGLEATCQFLAVAQLAYLRSYASADLDDAAIRDCLDRHHVSMGSWVQLAVELARRMPETRHPLCRTARAFFDGSGRLRGPLKTIQSEVVPLRNVWAHGPAATEAFEGKEQAVAKVWKELLQSLSLLRQLELISMVSLQRHEPGAYLHRVRLHQGAIPYFAVETRVTVEQLEAKWCYLRDDGGDVLSLKPYLRCGYHKGPTRHDLFLATPLPHDAEESTHYLSVTTGKPLEQPLSD